MAIIFGIKKFHKFIFGRNFILVTDHQPLKVIFDPSKIISVMSASRLVRWNVILSAYNYTIEYRRGSDLKEADALSRLPLNDATDVESAVNSFNLVDEIPLSSREIGEWSQKDPELIKVKDFCLRGWPNKVQEEWLRPFFRRRNEISVEGSCLMIGSRVIVPKVLRKRVLELIHTDHIGIVRCKMLARSAVWWPGLNEEIEEQISKCRVCQLMQNNAREENLIAWPKTENIWQRVHVDFFHFRGKSFLLIVDSKSKWLDVHLMNQGTDVNKTVEKLKITFALLGIPNSIVSDNGPPFNSAEFQRFCQLNGIIPLKSPPYHPQSNGIAERHVATVKNSLFKYLMEGSTLTLEQQVVNFLFSYRNTPSSITGMSPNEFLFRFKPRTRLDMLRPAANDSISVRQPDNFVSHKVFSVGEKVLVGGLGPAMGCKWKEGLIMKVISGVTYLVKVEDKILYKHVNNLRKSYLEEAHVSPSVVNTPQINVPDVLQSEVPGISLPNVDPGSGSSVSESDPRDSSHSNPAEVVKQPQATIEQPIADPGYTEPLRRSSRTIKPPQRLNL